MGILLDWVLVGFGVTIGATIALLFMAAIAAAINEALDRYGK